MAKIKRKEKKRNKKKKKESNGDKILHWRGRKTLPHYCKRRAAKPSWPGQKSPKSRPNELKITINPTKNAPTKSTKSAQLNINSPQRLRIHKYLFSSQQTKISSQSARFSFCGTILSQRSKNAIPPDFFRPIPAPLSIAPTSKGKVKKVAKCKNPCHQIVSFFSFLFFFFFLSRTSSSFGAVVITALRWPRLRGPALLCDSTASALCVLLAPHLRRKRRVLDQVSARDGHWGTKKKKKAEESKVQKVAFAFTLCDGL